MGGMCGAERPFFDWNRFSLPYSGISAPSFVDLYFVVVAFVVSQRTKKQNKTTMVTKTRRWMIQGGGRRG